MSLRTILMATACVAAASAPAGADGDDRVAPVTHEPTRIECGECHMAFQPAFLPARSWRRLMETLDDHFGENASLNGETAADIGAWLEANAGDRVGGKLARKFMRWVDPNGTPLRITDNPEFRREHDFRPAVWQRDDIRSPANCPACHRDADQGWFEDD